MISINVGGKDIPLFYNTKAMIDIGNRCGGDLSKLTEWLIEGTQCQMLQHVCEILCDLANGAIYKHNCDVAFGFDDGQKIDKFYTDEYFLSMINVNKLTEYQSAMFEAMGEGTQYKVPDNVKLEEKDEDLAEIEAERDGEKNS